MISFILNSNTELMFKFDEICLQTVADALMDFNELNYLNALQVDFLI